MSMLSDHIARDNKGRAITRCVSHDEVKAGDFLVTSYGIVEVTGKRTREDGWIEYTLKGQAPHANHPSNWPDIAIPVIMPVSGGSPEAPEVEAPVKVATRSGESLAHESVEAYRQGALPNLRVFQAGFTSAEWRSVGRRLVAYGCPVLGKGLDAETRLANFAYDCLNGSPVSFPEPVAQVEPPADIAPTVEEKPTVLDQYQADITRFGEAYPEYLGVLEGCECDECYRIHDEARDAWSKWLAGNRTPPPIGGGSPEVESAPLAGIAAKPPLTGIAPTRKMTASDYDVNLDDIRKEGWDLRYFTIVERAIRDGALEVLASSDYGCSVHGPGRDTYGDTDDDEQVDFMAWLRIIRSPIRLSARNFSQAWDEFIYDCREGSPVTFKTTLPPLDDDDLDAMESIFRETLERETSHDHREESAERSGRVQGSVRLSLPAVEVSPSMPGSIGVQGRLPRSGEGRDALAPTESLCGDGPVRRTTARCDPFDPDATILDMPVDPSHAYCWGDDESPLDGIQADDRPDADGYFIPWMQQGFDPMTCSEYEAMIALGLAPICGGSPEAGPEQDDRVSCPTCNGSGFVLEPDDATDVPSTRATPADATGEPADALMNEIRRLRARVAELEEEIEILESGDDF